jgi:hypothetical protein
MTHLCHKPAAEATENSAVQHAAATELEFQGYLAAFVQEMRR